MEIDRENRNLLDLIKKRASLKRDVYENMVERFEELKEILKEYAEHLRKEISAFDDRIRVKYVEKSKAEVQLIVAGDVLIFHMHSNVFLFENHHHIYKTSYVKDNTDNAFVGSILIYNFLHDSLKYHRMDDMGYMIARVFINNEDHYFAEGKNELGYKFNNFAENKISKDDWIKIIETCLVYTLDFNLFVPPYNRVNLLTVSQVREQGQEINIKTDKRMGFEFSNRSDVT